MSIPFINLHAQQSRIRDQIDANIKKVLDHGQYIMGPEVPELEERLADYVGVKHCIGVSSGTDALLMALMAVGVQPGDEVITSAFTFIATGEMIALLGATPVFVDIDPITYNIDPKEIEKAITPKTKAIMPVSLYGQCADFTLINQIAHSYNIPVIEDAAQSFGAQHHNKMSCSLSDIGCTSFFPSKPLGGYGDGGACFTNDDELAKILRELRVHGQEKRYQHVRVGINGRLDTIQAAILLAKFNLFPEEVALRAELGNRYNTLLADLPDIVTPTTAPNNSHVYAQYTVQVKNRADMQAKLKTLGIPTAVHYPVPLHKQLALWQENTTLPHAETVSEQVMSLPMHPYMTEQEQKTIVDGVSTNQ